LRRSSRSSRRLESRTKEPQQQEFALIRLRGNEWGRVGPPTKLERCVAAKKKQSSDPREVSLPPFFFTEIVFLFCQWNRQLPLMMTPRLLLLLLIIIAVRRKGRGLEGSVCDRQRGSDRRQCNTIQYNTIKHNTTQNLPTHWMSQSYYIPVESVLYIYIYGRRSRRTCSRFNG